MKRNFRLIGHMLGLLLLILGTAMLVPAALDGNDGHHNAVVFLHGALVAWFAGGLLVLTQRGRRHIMPLAELTVQETFLLTVLGWAAGGVICALPLWFSDLEISFTDALFESVSGITTTGASVLTGLDTLSRGLLLWRAMTQMFGGIGIIAFAILLLPALRIGGMQILHNDGGEGGEKIVPRAAAAVRSLLLVYLTLSALCAVAYYASGMTGFDAVTHSLATISTGGFSTRDASFGAFGTITQIVAMTFMVLAALPFILYLRLFAQNISSFAPALLLRDPQIRLFLRLVLFFTALLFAAALFLTDMTVATALRHSSFSIISILSTTGFTTTDYQQWGGFAVALLFFATYLGACAGSTGGGIKMMRIIVAMKALSIQFKRLIYPHGTFVLAYDGHAVPTLTVYGVLGFLFVYVATNTILAIGLALTGLDFATALSAAAAAIANVGPGIGPVIGPAGSYAPLPDAAKLMLCAGMIAGRLEIMTLLVLLTPAFWRR